MTPSWHDSGDREVSRSGYISALHGNHRGMSVHWLVVPVATIRLRAR
jgi:hypothetical protein